MDWYYKGLKEIIDHIIYNYGSTWMIISHKEIVIEMTIDCIGYEYINNKWTEIEDYHPGSYTCYKICHHKLYDVNQIIAKYHKKCMLRRGLLEIEDIYYIGNSTRSNIKDDTRLNPDNVLAEIQSRLERPKMTTFWIFDLLVKYNK